MARLLCVAHYPGPHCSTLLRACRRFVRFEAPRSQGLLHNPCCRSAVPVVWVRLKGFEALEDLQRFDADPIVG
jgi:hypothetical protein